MIIFTKRSPVSHTGLLCCTKAVTHFLDESKVTLQGLVDTIFIQLSPHVALSCIHIQAGLVPQEGLQHCLKRIRWKQIKETSFKSQAVRPHRDDENSNLFNQAMLLVHLFEWSRFSCSVGWDLIRPLLRQSTVLWSATPAEVACWLCQVTL